MVAVQDVTPTPHDTENIAELMRFEATAVVSTREYINSAQIIVLSQVNFLLAECFFTVSTTDAVTVDELARISVLNHIFRDLHTVNRNLTGVPLLAGHTARLESFLDLDGGLRLPDLIHFYSGRSDDTARCLVTNGGRSQEPDGFSDRPVSHESATVPQIRRNALPRCQLEFLVQ